MAIAAAPVKIATKVSKKFTEKIDVSPEVNRKKLSLKDMQGKQYPFLDSDVPDMFDEMLKAGMIELPEMKRPEEAGRAGDPNYCKYHRLVGHPIEKCFIFKDKIMELARKGRILLEEDKVTAN